MKVIDYSDRKELDKTLARGSLGYGEAIDAARKILSDVKRDGDSAVFEYTRKFDGFDLSEKNLKVASSELKNAYNKVDAKVVKALKHAAKNVKSFHQMQYRQIDCEWEYMTEKGVTVGEKASPIDSAGCYVPGGRASYPSTVLMTCIPAKVAGVQRIVVATPPPTRPAVLVACDIAGVDEILRIGGAQAIGALAYGTQSVRKVSKIVGPGNKYVTAAKMLVYGAVDIDLPAGPSEVLILADESSNPKFIAADLLAQAEHDPDAQSVLASSSGELIRDVSIELSKMKAERKLGEIVCVKTSSLKESINFANEYAPEHLEVATKNAEKDARKIRNAGAIFVGAYSCVAAGDYATGANHVLPTGGTAKFASQLSVRDFLKTSSVQKLTKEGLERIGETIMTLAENEGLHAHKNSVKTRLA